MFKLPNFLNFGKSEEETKPRSKLSKEVQNLGLGERAEQHNTPTRDNRILQKQMKILFIVTICSVTMNFGQMGTLLAVLPLKTLVPLIMFSYSDSDEIVHLQPTPISDTNARFLVEQIVRQYVANRNSFFPFHEEMEIRWFSEDSFLANHSSAQVYLAFSQEAQETWSLQNSVPTIRRVTINKVTTTSFPVWQVDFITRDSELGSNETQAIRSWRADIHLAVKQYPDTVTKGDIIKNPLGIEIIHYEQREIRPRAPKTDTEN